MSILCFGGSFNPIHHGHLLSAIAVAEARGFERVILIPSGKPPHKRHDTDIADGHHRIEMCRRAIRQNALFTVLDVEVVSPNWSYTIDTVRELRRQGYPAISWLVGADQAPFLPKWHKAKELIEECELILMRRPGFRLDVSALSPSFQKLEANIVDTPQLDFSASNIRQRIVDGKSIDYLTPEAVVDYIAEHRLYQPG